MDLIGVLSQLLSGNRKKAQPSVPPDITYNPNPNTNIPYSAHTPQAAQQGNRYNANPTAPEFLGVDPAKFGYPADNSASQRPPNRFNLYNQDGIASIGGRYQLPNGDYLGGTIGLDRGIPFGSVNRRGRILGQFGPQDSF